MKVLLQLTKIQVENGCPVHGSLALTADTQRPRGCISPRDNWYDLPVNWMRFTHSTDALIPGHVQHKIGKPDSSFTRWVAHAAEIEPAGEQRHR